MSQGTGQIAQAASVVSGATFLSRILGYIRDMVIAHGFGTGTAADAFFVAFRIPNMLRELLGEGALSAAFIPVFAQVRAERGKETALRVATTTFWVLGVLLTITCLVGIVLSPWVVRLIGPGFWEIPEKFALTVKLTRMMFPYLLFAGLSALMMGTLNSLGHFALPALSPALLNISIITAAILLGPKLGEPVLALAVGVLFGGVMQVALQVPPLVTRGMSFIPQGSPADPAILRIGHLMGPRAIGLGVTQLHVLVTTILATLVGGGAVSTLYYAFRLVHLPIGMVGVAVATAAFPVMAARVAARSIGEVHHACMASLRLILFLTLPALVGLVVFRREIVSLLFERGAFSAQATQGTAAVILAYCVGLIFFVVNRLLVSTFYAFQDTASPVKAGMIGVGIGTGLSLVLMGPMGVPGLALATSLGSAVSCWCLGRWLVRYLGPWQWRDLLPPLAKMGWAAGVMAVTAVLSRSFWPPLAASSWSARALVFTIEGMLTLCAYYGVTRILGLPEASGLREKLRGGT
ncbi:MAG: murein biosynthesis integral membrane protein MurJ [Candidatus Methylomirabilales bacterium]